jgi:hypothetical protein
MKKIFMFLGLMAIASIAKADGWWSGGNRSDEYTVTFSSALISSASTNTILISLSSSSYFNHPPNQRSIIIDYIRVSVDKAAATTSTIKLGVVKEINTTAGTVAWFYTKGFALNVSNTTPESILTYTPNLYNCRVNISNNLGYTPYLTTNDVTVGSAVYTTILNLPIIGLGGVITQLPPHTGDIILNVVDGAAVVNLQVTIIYHTEAQ